MPDKFAASRSFSKQPAQASRPEKIGLPPRIFLYSLDQIAMLLDIELKSLKSNYIYYEGRSTGVRRRDYISSRNIAPDGEKPEWRVAEKELIRWFKHKGFKYIERGWLMY